MKQVLVLAAFLLALSLPGAPALAMATAMVASCAPGMASRTETLYGMFNVHVLCDRVLFEIPPALLNRDMLLNTEFAALSSGSDQAAPGSVVDNRVVRWVRRGNKILLEEVRYEIWAQNMPNLQRGVETASLRTVIKALEIIGENEGAPLVDITGLFVTEVPEGFALEFMHHFRMRAVDPQRSYIETVKAFSQNIDIRYYQTWVPDPAELRNAVAEGAEKIPPALGFIFHTSLLLLPEVPMRGRYWDPRVGYFASEFDDYGTDDHGKVRRAYIQRYRLEKKYPDAPVSPPVKPIVFHLSREVPGKWRPYIKQGVEDWQSVFEKAGFRDAILARDAPDQEEDPDWDPEDVRFNVIRWTPSGRQNAMGPAVIDPRSGEVISSHAIFWHDVLRLAETWYFTQAAPLDPAARTLPLPEETIGRMLRYIVSHEIGHALGLRHNFKAHSAYAVDQLRSPEWTGRWGISASIMDYARLNYVAQPGDGAHLLPRFGPYDYFAIEWGYGQFYGGMSCDDEWPLLDALASRQVEDPMLRFGGEDESAELDPQVNTNVIGSNPVEAADLGLHNVDRVMRLLLPGTTRLGGEYDRLRDMYNALVTLRHRQLAAVAKLVGGVEETRSLAGRGPVPFKPVRADRQRTAVKFLLDRGFSTPRTLLDPAVLMRISPTGGADALQGSNASLLRQLLDPSVMLRMAEARQLAGKAGGYVGIDMLRDLNDGLFRELSSARPVIELYRRELQRNYVTLLLVASGTIGDPQAQSNSLDMAGSGSRTPLQAGARRLTNQRAAASPLADAARRLQHDRNRPTESSAAVRAGVAHLHAGIGTALARVRDAETAAHLRGLQAELSRIP